MEYTTEYKTEIIMQLWECLEEVIPTKRYKFT